MDSILALRQEFNGLLAKEGGKLSVNDFIIKAAGLACLKVINLLLYDALLYQS